MMGTGSFTDRFKGTVCLAGMQVKCALWPGIGPVLGRATCRALCILSPAGFKRQQAMGHKLGASPGS